MSQIDNILIQVRAKLKDNNIKLWLEPYYFAEIGSNDDEIEVRFFFIYFHLFL